MNLEELTITDAWCNHDNKLHYRVHIHHSDIEDVNKRASLDNNNNFSKLYGYCLLDSTECPFYHIHKQQPYCKFPDYKLK